MYQDVNQQQVLGVATLGMQQVLHTEFCWIRCETTAVPVQPVIDLHQQRTHKKIIHFEVKVKLLFVAIEAGDTRAPAGGGWGCTNPERMSSCIQYFYLQLL